MKQLFTLLAVLFSVTVFGQNVGIGETAPTETRLQVKRADSALLLLHNSSTGADVKTGLFFKSGNSYSGSIITTGNTLAQTFRMGFSTFGSPTPSGLVERISILDGGNVGIGNTNPLAKLDINGQIKITGGTPGVGKLLESDATGLATWSDKSASFLPTGASGNTLRHTGVGWTANSLLYNNGTNIGIGTTNPSSKLEVLSSGYGILQNDGTVSVGTYTSSTGGWIGTKTNHPLHFFSNNSAERMTLSTSGNFGIGTTNPNASIEVARGTGVGGTAQFNGTNYTSHINYSTTEDTYLRGGKTSSKVFINDQANGNVLLAGGGGNVGIGTPNPSSKLEVNGTIKITDGNQGNGRVLTSDANGNATWKAQAYGNTERFHFRVRSLNGNTANLLTIYNYGTATAEYFAPTEALIVHINKSGLYHLDINVNQDCALDYSVTSANAQPMTIYYDTYRAALSPFYKFTSYGSYSSIDKSYEVYLTAGSDYAIFAQKKSSATDYIVSIAGHLISE
jgi:hypothetical protein